MKLQIIQTIKQGLDVIIKNPIILAPIVISAILQCVDHYFHVPVQKYVLNSILVILVLVFLALIICKMVYDAVKSKVSLFWAIKLSARKFIFILIAAILYALSLIVFFAFVFLGVAIFCVLAGFISVVIGVSISHIPCAIIGSILGAIPGSFLSIKFIFYSYAILLDNEKIINSFRKSWQITKGNWWRIFGLYYIFMIPSIFLIWLSASLIALERPQITLISLLVGLFSLLIGSFLLNWSISAFTIAYIQLTKHASKHSEQSITGENEVFTK